MGTRSGGACRVSQNKTLDANKTPERTANDRPQNADDKDKGPLSQEPVANTAAAVMSQYSRITNHVTLSKVLTSRLNEDDSGGMGDYKLAGS